MVGCIFQENNVNIYHGLFINDVSATYIYRVDSLRWWCICAWGVPVTLCCGYLHFGSSCPPPAIESMTGPSLHACSGLSLCCVQQEFVTGLSVLARGSFHEKLQWAFSLYDINGDGIITKDEMLDIVSAMYSMMGKFADPCIDEHTAKDHVERVFQVSHG